MPFAARAANQSRFTEREHVWTVAAPVNRICHAPLRRRLFDARPRRVPTVPRKSISALPPPRRLKPKRTPAAATNSPKPPIPEFDPCDLSAAALDARLFAFRDADPPIANNPAERRRRALVTYHHILMPYYRAVARWEARGYDVSHCAADNWSGPPLPPHVQCAYCEFLRVPRDAKRDARIARRAAAIAAGKRKSAPRDSNGKRLLATRFHDKPLNLSTAAADAGVLRSLASAFFRRPITAAVSTAAIRRQPFLSRSSQPSRAFLIRIEPSSPSSMAWHCGGKTNAELIDNLIRASIIRTQPVADAMRSVDRAKYCPDVSRAYADSPQSIGHAATISAPHMHAQCLELLAPNLKPGARALDVGSGSGYLVSCMAEMVKPSGYVYGVDHIPELVAQSVKNINADSKQILGKLADVRVSDGRLGIPSAAPFDCIHVGAAAPHIPEALKTQLKVGGRLVIPVGKAGDAQELLLISRKSDTEFVSQTICGVVYVPLTDAPKSAATATATATAAAAAATAATATAAATAAAPAAKK